MSKKTPFICWSEGEETGVCLGSPNPDAQHFINLPKEKAKEVSEKLNLFLSDSGI